MLNRYCQGHRIKQSIPLRDSQTHEEGATFNRDCVVAKPTQANFLFAVKTIIDEETIAGLRCFGVGDNGAKTIAAFRTTWVNLYLTLTECVENYENTDTFHVNSTTHEMHQFLQNAYLPSKERKSIPDDINNNMNRLLEHWYPKVYRHYFQSELVSDNIRKQIGMKGLEAMVSQEITNTIKISGKAQSIESKIWYQAVSDASRVTHLRGPTLTNTCFSGRRWMSRGSSILKPKPITGHPS